MPEFLGGKIAINDFTQIFTPTDHSHQDIRAPDSHFGPNPGVKHAFSIKNQFSIPANLIKGLNSGWELLQSMILHKFSPLPIIHSMIAPDSHVGPYPEYMLLSLKVGFVSQIAWSKCACIMGRKIVVNDFAQVKQIKIFPIQD